MQFLKSKDLSLNEGNYLVNLEGAPITNTQFVEEQVKAHFLVTLANKCEGKVFKIEKAACFKALLEETDKEVKATTSTVYFEKSAEPKSKVLDELTKVALAFSLTATSNNRVEKLNKLLQEYNCINKVENFGMYFIEGVVELTKIYSIADIKAAAEVIIDIE